MQGCQLVESHKSAGSGPVRSPEAVPARKQTRKQTKNNKAKTGKKTHNHNKTKTKTTQRSGIATSNGNYMHDDILCVIMRMAQNKKQNRGTTKHTNGPCWWVREATKLEASADISISAIGAIPHRTRGFRAFRELDHCILQNELEAAYETVQELILACDPGTQLEKAMQLIFATMEDMMIIISAPIELSS